MQSLVFSVPKALVDRPSERFASRRANRNLNYAVCLFFVLALLLSGCGRKKNRATIPVSTRPPMASVPGAWEEGIASWYGHPYHGRRTANGEIYDQEKMTAAHPSLRFNTTVEVTNLNNGLRTRVRINDRGPFVKNRAIDLSRAAARQIEMLGPGTAPVRVEVIAVAGTAAAGQASSAAAVSNSTQATAPVESATSRPRPVSTVPAKYPVSAAPSESNVNPLAGSAPSVGSSEAVDAGTATPAVSESGGFAIQVGAFASYENAVRLRETLAERYSPVRIIETADPAGGDRVLWRVLVGERLPRAVAEELFSSLRVDFPRIFLISDH